MGERLGGEGSRTLCLTDPNVGEILGLPGAKAISASQRLAKSIRKHLSITHTRHTPGVSARHARL
jgi:hypothetical protein